MFTWGSIGRASLCRDDLYERLPGETQEVWPVQYCAEVDAVAQAMNDGESFDDLVQKTVNRSGGNYPPCKNCEQWVP